MSRKILQQALEALETCDEGDYSTGHVIHPSFDEKAVDAAITALRAHLDNTKEQEPVAWRIEVDQYNNQWFTDDLDEACDTLTNDNAVAVPLYLSPTIPPGYVLVPEEPTEATIEAARTAAWESAQLLRSLQPLDSKTWDDSCKHRYKAMLAAAKKGE